MKANSIVVSTLLLCFALLVGFSCRKDQEKKSTIHGTVMNKATKQPVAGLTVALLSTEDTRRSAFPFGRTVSGSFKTSKEQTTTDADGNFVFDNVEIHTHPDFRYQLFTTSNQSLNNGHSEFNDDNIDVDAKNTGKIYQLTVEPLMDYLFIKLANPGSVNLPDSVNVKTSHKFFGNQKLFDDSVKSDCLAYGNSCYALQHETMGWWYLDIYKFKGGQVLKNRDSIFLNYGDSITYTFSF